MFANRMIFFVVCARSDQWPNKGPARSPLKLNADRLRPRKYGAAFSVCRYLHIVGKITAVKRHIYYYLDLLINIFINREFGYRTKISFLNFVSYTSLIV